MALNGSNTKNRIVWSTLNLESHVVFLGVKASNKNVREILLVAVAAVSAEPLVLKGTIVADGCLAIVPQHPRKVFRELLFEQGTKRPVDDVCPLRFLVSLTPALVDCYFLAIVIHNHWGVPEIMEILVVLNRLGHGGRTG